MNVSMQKTSEVSGRLTVAITAADYADKVKEDLKKIGKTHTIPGFRKGHVSLTDLQRRFGRQVTSDVINETVYKAVIDYINDNKLEVLGHPVPVEVVELDLKNKTDFTFEYDLALAPALDIKIDKDITIPYYPIEVSDDMVKEQDEDESEEKYENPDGSPIIFDTDFFGERRSDFGFAQKAERDLFLLLIGVSGIGGQMARMILSAFTPAELAAIISEENVRLLKSVKGIGPKVAQRIIVDLKDKKFGDLGIAGAAGVDAGGAAAFASGEVVDEAVAALTMLGFSPAPAQKVVREIVKAEPDIPVEKIIKQALKML